MTLFQDFPSSKSVVFDISNWVVALIVAVVVVVAVVGGGGSEVPLPSKTAIFLFQK